MEGESLGWLTTSFVHLNVLQVAAICSVIVVAGRFLPPVHRRIQVRRRAERFYKDWRGFKRVLLEYRDTKSTALQKRYASLLERLRRDYSYFAPTLIRIKRSFPHGEYAESSVNNLESCFRVNELADWQRRVRKSLPDEVDCFDSMFLALIEHGPDVRAEAGPGQ